VTLTAILVFALATLLAGWLLPSRWRVWFLLAASILAAYWLQPSTPIRNLDYWFPTASIALTVITWAVTRTPLEAAGRRSWAAMALAATYDAAELARLNVRGIEPNAKEAQRWYELARQLGAGEAEQRLRRLGAN